MSASVLAVWVANSSEVTLDATRSFRKTSKMPESLTSLFVTVEPHAEKHSAIKIHLKQQKFTGTRYFDGFLSLLSHANNHVTSRPTDPAHYVITLRIINMRT